MLQRTRRGSTGSTATPRPWELFSPQRVGQVPAPAMVARQPEAAGVLHAVDDVRVAEAPVERVPLLGGVGRDVARRRPTSLGKTSGMRRVAVPGGRDPAAASSPRPPPSAPPAARDRSSSTVTWKDCAAAPPEFRAVTVTVSATATSVGNADLAGPGIDGGPGARHREASASPRKKAFARRSARPSAGRRSPRASSPTGSGATWVIASAAVSALAIARRARGADAAGQPGEVVLGARHIGGAGGAGDLGAVAAPLQRQRRGGHPAPEPGRHHDLRADLARARQHGGRRRSGGSGRGGSRSPAADRRGRARSLLRASAATRTISVAARWIGDQGPRGRGGSGARRHGREAPRRCGRQACRPMGCPPPHPSIPPPWRGICTPEPESNRPSGQVIVAFPVMAERAAAGGASGGGADSAARIRPMEFRAWPGSPPRGHGGPAWRTDRDPSTTVVPGGTPRLGADHLAGTVLLDCGSSFGSRCRRSG